MKPEINVLMKHHGTEAKDLAYPIFSINRKNHEPLFHQ